jgi:hypothetical protein
MAELPELRTIANASGGSTTMLLERQRSDSPESIFVLGSDTSCGEADLQRAGISGASGTSNAYGLQSQRQAGKDGPDLGISRAPWWALLDLDDRKVFNNWALAVTAFYLSFVILLLAAVLGGVYLPADGEPLSASSVVEHSSAELPAPATRSIDK